MKKLGKLKLTQLNKVELEKRQMNVLKGGWGDDNDSCACTEYSPVKTTYVGQSTANSGSGY